MKLPYDFFVQIKKCEIGFYSQFFDAFEHMVSVRTPEPPKGEFGTMHCMVCADFLSDFKKILKKHELEYKNSPLTPLLKREGDRTSKEGGGRV